MLYMIIFSVTEKKKKREFFMKIVQVNTICGVGSIGRICVDLYETLQKNGEEAYIATGRGSLPPGIKGAM